jgi:adenine-specific DNA-methyltransferase
VLNTVVNNTNQFIASVPKSKRKAYGQFFTNMATARFMASLFRFNLQLPEIRLLDAGAGTGILAAAAVERLFTSGYQGHVHVTCYETDPMVIPVLTQNMQSLQAHCSITFTVCTQNYLTSQSFAPDLFNDSSADTYDYIIGNPPYLKIAKEAPESRTMAEVCHGAPNLYFLFWAMGIYNLKPGQEMVYIIPRSWTSGAYFKQFRRFLFAHCVITDLHLFESRDTANLCCRRR